MNCILDELLCDLAKDRILIDPRVLGCGLSVCYDCIKTTFTYDVVKSILQCKCCCKEHVVLKLGELPENARIANIIAKNILFVTSESMERTNTILQESKGKNRHILYKM